MTNKQDDREETKESNRIAAMLAVHLVSQVLDEACVIANSAQESDVNVNTGQPWTYLAMLKKFENNGVGLIYDEGGPFNTPKGDNVNENKIDVVANVVTTSTPQKIAAREIECSDELRFDSTLIGQGDEEIDRNQGEMTNSTSMFINHLFDMSEVEREFNCDDSEKKQTNSEHNTLLAEAMNMMIESYVANVSMPLVELPILNDNIQENIVPLSGQVSSDHSEFSFLTDAYVSPTTNDIAFYINENVEERNNGYEASQIGTIGDNITQQAEKQDTKANTQTDDFQLYENSYTTMNRDYDLCSEEDGYPILQDPKEITLQEVELMTANSSNEDLESYAHNRTVPKRKEAVTVSGISGSRRSTLARRCRYQGAKLFSCLRGWWRRKVPGKRNESRVSVAEVCPLSPDARRRASSLLDNRLLRSPSPSRPIMWKFNTVNEALVNSNRWKDYTFDMTAGDSGEL